MPQTPTMSADGSSGIGSIFSSTISTRQPAGHRAARVASPSGGVSARLPVIMLIAHRELHQLSGNRGFISSRRMGTPEDVKSCWLSEQPRPSDGQLNEQSAWHN